MQKINWLAFILEEQKLSMGRVMAWAMFGILVFMWIRGTLVPDTLITSFFVLLSYNFGKKLTDPLTGVIKNVTDKVGSSSSAGSDDSNDA